MDEPVTTAAQRGSAKSARILIKALAAPTLTNPGWIRVRVAHSDTFRGVKQVLREQGLHTDCEAGVKARDFLRDIAELETNRNYQPVVRPTLQTTLDDDVFAIGDGAACAWPEADHGNGGFVPPRAQAAHQQSMYLSLYKMHELALHGFPKVGWTRWRG